MLTSFGFVAVLNPWAIHALELSVQAVDMEKGTANSFLNERINREECLFAMPWLLYLSALWNLYKKKNLYLMSRSSNNLLILGFKSYTNAK